MWQLAEEIRVEVFRLTEKPRFNADFKARGQADDATNSMTRNIAEGFGCESHAEFARFLEISRRSLNELQDILHGAELKKYVSASELTPIKQLSTRLYPAYSRFIAYLKRTPNVRRRRGAAPHRQIKQARTDRDRPRSDERQVPRTDKDRDRTDKDRDRTDKDQ